MEYVWIFHGERSKFCSAVFKSLKQAKSWVFKYSLSGILTKYPMNISCYDWAVEEKLYEIKDTDLANKKMESFTSHAQEHYHFCNGKID